MVCSPTGRLRSRRWTTFLSQSNEMSRTQEADSRVLEQVETQVGAVSQVLDDLITVLQEACVREINMVPAVRADLGNYLSCLEAMQRKINAATAALLVKPAVRAQLKATRLQVGEGPGDEAAELRELAPRSARVKGRDRHRNRPGGPRDPRARKAVAEHNEAAKGETREVPQ